MSWVTFRLRDQSNRCISFGPHFSTHSGSVSCLLLILTPSPSLSVLLSLFTFPTLSRRRRNETNIPCDTAHDATLRIMWAVCLVTRPASRPSRLSLTPLVPEARRRRRSDGWSGEGRREPSRQTLNGTGRDVEWHVTSRGGCSEWCPIRPTKGTKRDRADTTHIIRPSHPHPAPHLIPYL